MHPFGTQLTLPPSGEGSSDVDISSKADKVGSSDIEITDSTKGLILRSPDGTRWRIVVDDQGGLDTAEVV